MGSNSGGRKHRTNPHNRSLRLAWIAIEPTPYDRPLYAALSKYDCLDLEVLCVIPYSRFDWMREDDAAFVSERSRGWRFRLGFDALQTLNIGVLRAVCSERWDCVVIPGYSNPTALLAIVLCILLRISFIVRADTTLFRPRGWLRTLMKRLFVFPLVRRCTAAMAVSGETVKYFESLGIRRDRVFLVPCVSHLDDYRQVVEELSGVQAAIRPELETPGDACVGVFVGRFVHNKGIDRLLEGLKELPPSKRPYLWLLGDGPLRKRLAEFVERHGLPVRFGGFVQNRMLPRYLLAADFFVLPSRSEPWGIVVAEAMTCGLPVVLSREVGAGYDLLREGENGFWAKGDTGAAWEEVLRRCVERRDILPRMGEAAKEAVRPWGRNMAVEGFLASIRVATGRDIMHEAGESQE